jgi:hypothetical protein
MVCDCEFVPIVTVNFLFLCLQSQLESKAVGHPDGSITVSGRDLRRNMRRTRRDVQDRRYRYLNTWCTDGTLAFRHVADTTRPSRRQLHWPLQGFHLGEVENKLGNIRKIAGEQDPLEHFGSVVGIDLGHVFSAAAFRSANGSFEVQRRAQNLQQVPLR